jgi:hypothetical protein
MKIEESKTKKIEKNDLNTHKGSFGKKYFN